ncbi:MAG: patatin-like phospholipase family protein [Leptospiraceae bacterium]|nr:patatin-like phospholipase family protein [Leptospiraceae bacterium]MCP5512233.1 patatin-like phospholipase family protein [Leptospiraceae bacterium]
MEKIKYILISIYGGGIKGIIPARILYHIEKILQKKLGNNQISLSDTIDIIGGTSTGSLIALAMSLKDEKNRFVYTLKDVLNYYLIEGKKIFYLSPIQLLHSLFGLESAKYPSEPLEASLEVLLGKSTLADLKIPILIPAHELKRGYLYFFTAHNYLDKKENFFLKDIARAATAAPTMFKPALIQSLQGRNYSFVDGAVFANNPSLCTYIEACKLYPDLTPSNSLFLSLGTGYAKDKTPGVNLFSEAGTLDWLPYLLNIFMNNSVDLPEYQLKYIYKMNNVPQNYIHLDFELDPNKNEVDNITRQYLQYLIESTDDFLDSKNDLIEKIVSILEEKLVFEK